MQCNWKNTGYIAYIKLYSIVQKYWSILNRSNFSDKYFNDVTYVETEIKNCLNYLMIDLCKLLKSINNNLLICEFQLFSYFQMQYFYKEKYD